MSSVLGLPPQDSPVEVTALADKDAHNGTALDRLGVGLLDDLEDIEREEEDLTDTDQTEGIRGVSTTPIARAERYTHLPAVAWSQGL